MSKKNFNKLFLKYTDPIDSAGKPKTHELTHGVCFYWAYCFHKIYGGELVTLESWNRGEDFAGHAVVKLNGKYFDGDSPEGRVDSGNVLATEIIHKTTKQFFKKWRCDRDLSKVKALRRSLNGLQ